jgi:hypothetical protein
MQDSDLLSDSELQGPSAKRPKIYEEEEDQLQETVLATPLSSNPPSQPPSQQQTSSQQQHQQQLPQEWQSIVTESLKIQEQQTALRDQLLCLEPGRVLELPLHRSLSPRLQKEVNESESRLYCIQRRSFSDLTDFVQKKKGLTSITGPQGAGKSFALYHLWCALSALEDHRVLYIPHCGSLNDPEDSDMIDAFIAAFSRDALDFFNHMLSTKRLDANYKPKSWQAFLRQVNIFCKERNLAFVAIFDQYNSLEQSRRKTGPTDFQFWPLYIGNARIIVSASANNEEEPIKTEDKLAPYLFRSGYEPEELQAWQISHNFFVNEDISDLAKITASLPLEIDTAWDLLQANPALSYPELVSQHMESRLVSLNDSYEAFRLKHLLTLERQEDEKKCVWHAAFGVPLPPSSALTFDRKLFLIHRPSAYEKLSIEPVTPLVRQMAEARVQARPLADVESMVSSSLRSSIPSNDAKRRIVKGYIIHKLSKDRSIDLHLCQVGSASTTKLVIVRDYDFVRFDHLIPKESPSQSTIFVPSNPNYPEIGIFIWDHPNRTLYAIQVTVGGSDQESEPITKHIDVYGQWRTFSKWKECHKIWITSKSLEKPPPTFAEACKDHFYLDIHNPNFVEQLPGLKAFSLS